MSDDEQPTHTAREIVLEFFPATPARLLPRTPTYRLERGDDGSLVVLTVARKELRRLTPVHAAGAPSVQLCCDLCGWSGARDRLQVLRSEVPGSHGRRFRYLTACLDTDSCDARRLDDAGIESLLRTG